ncbi:uncharacterized protein LOC114930332 isoform X3 [Nylanderia fulva]|uniref:uncharacterized protein LOC114930332 isoform X3 n=1 Tax=Nylanderia fulva TaxID=613905 RepID=UPI0010FB4775|nr:uncharacterized protein LOC114930332 isoform X3 [Nylanderia fulva]
MLFVSKYKERVSVIINMAMILNDLFDSSDDEKNNMLFPFQPIMRNDDDALAPNIIKYPTDLEKEQTSNFYLQQKRFPNIIVLSMVLK